METEQKPFDLEEAIARFKEVTLRELDSLVSEYDVSQRIEISRALDVEAQHLVRRAAYVGERAGNDVGHAAGVKKQNSVVAKLRQALGYSYPRQDVNF